jgi:hypothetical protein
MKRPRPSAGRACPCAWEHCVPKMAYAAPRMSLTFRHIKDNPYSFPGSGVISIPATT